ncbi:tetraacyldisaccharide 4'-kinase [Persicirhabdus sediminis]|uniref:Tetraacyldisaccharide 4'-kinase n=1 Tax=Persicirhabdus sediminis TaxID=454144 RepID=A0A8J7MDD6_9BACT|nr:tetraacyldisaccharide 4'-kinase [Persicirhabdus sediminis]MBK1790883.1 tetraacyldisaccharide 4'-kinase [Persicirhabdus sediminis]
MKETFQEFEKWATDVIFGRAKGFRATMMRLLLYAFSGLYRLAVHLRLKGFRSGKRIQHYLGTEVISIGNLTVGGTGKTPVVEMFAKALTERGRKVAVLSRGYKSKNLKQAQKWPSRHTGELIPAERMPKVVSTGGDLLLDVKFAGDEPWMLAKNLPGVSMIVDKDRVKGGEFAVGELECNTLLLDDGLQFLKLAHSIDIVLVDQNSPFGTGQMLPRGTLREPAKNICRADYIFITKCNGSPNDDLIRKIRKHNRTAEIIECTHGPQFLENVFTGEREELDFLDGKYVAAISGIAVPESFEEKLTSLGANVEFHRVFADHHSFSRKEINRFMRRCIERDIDIIVTTEKDAVRFPKPEELDTPIYYLRIEVDIISGHEVWQSLLDRVCSPRPTADPLLLRQIPA